MEERTMKLRTAAMAIACAAALLGGACDKKADEAAKPTEQAKPAEKAAEKAAEGAAEAGKAAAEAGAKAAEAGAKAAEAAAKAAAEAAKGGEAAVKAAAEATAQAEAAAKNANAAVAAAVDQANALAANAQDGSAALTEAELEKLLLGLAACSVTDRGIDSKCEAKKAWDEGRKRNTSLKDIAGMYASLGKKHIGHESPAIRITTASLMGSIFGSSADTQAIILEAAGKEQEPEVLRSMIRTVGSSISKNPGVKDLVMKAADHAEERVRIEAASWLTSSFSDGVEGTFEKALSMIETDASPKVRTYACREIARREDDRALAVLEKLTADPDKDPAMYEACMEGIVKMWVGFPKPKKPSQKAYELTLQRLGEKPRSKVRPARGIFFDFTATVPSRENDTFHKAWADAATWYKQDDLMAALRDVVTDRAANWMARTSAVDTLVKLGETKEQLGKLSATYADAEKIGDDSHVARKLAEAAK
jgi:hypothetical protein